MRHEERLARQLVQEALAQCQGKPVLAVYLAVARCSQADLGALRFYWDQAAVGTPCQGARVYLREVPFVQECPNCRHRFAAKRQHAACPNCRAEHTATLMGDECALVEQVTVYEGTPTALLKAAL